MPAAAPAPPGLLRHSAQQHRSPGQQRVCCARKPLSLQNVSLAGSGFRGPVVSLMLAVTCTASKPCTQAAHPPRPESTHRQPACAPKRAWAPCTAINPHILCNHSLQPFTATRQPTSQHKRGAPALQGRHLQPMRSMRPPPSLAASSPCTLLPRNLQNVTAWSQAAAWRGSRLEVCEVTCPSTRSAHAMRTRKQHARQLVREQRARQARAMGERRGCCSPNVASHNALAQAGMLCEWQATRMARYGRGTAAQAQSAHFASAVPNTAREHCTSKARPSLHKLARPGADEDCAHPHDAFVWHPCEGLGLF